MSRKACCKQTYDMYECMWYMSRLLNDEGQLIKLVNDLTCALAEMSSLSWLLSPIEASVNSFSHGSCKPGPAEQTTHELAVSLHKGRDGEGINY